MFNNNRNSHAHNGRIQDTTLLHSSDEFAGCNLNSGNTPTSVKPVPPKQSTTSVLRQWRRPDTVDSGPKHAPSKDAPYAAPKYSKVPQSGPDSDRPPNTGYPSSLDSPAEYSMYNQQQHSTAVPPNRPYLSHVQYGDSTGYSRASSVPPAKQDARVPDSVVKYSSAGQYYAQDSTREVLFRGASYPGQSTPPLAHSANAKSGYANAEGHNYAPPGQKLSSPNYHYPMGAQTYPQKLQAHDSKSTSQTIADEPNPYCLKSGAYPAQNRVPQHPNVPYSIQNQPYYVNKSTCLTQEMRHGRQSYPSDKPGGYPNAYAQAYLAQKPGLASPQQEQKSRDYRQIVPAKKSPPFPILEQRLSAEGSSPFYPEYGAGAYAHHKYGAVMLPGSTQKMPRDNYLNSSGPKFPPEDIIPSSYAKYYAQNKVAYEPNHYLLQMNQMQSRLNPNLFSRSTELPRDMAYMDQTARGLSKSRIQYNAMDPSQYGTKSSNVGGVQKPAKIVSYSSLQDQRLAEHPSGEYFRNYPSLAKQQSVIQSSKMVLDSYNMPGRSEAGHEPQSYAYSPPLIHQGNRPALAQYPTNYRPSPKTNDVSSGNISPRRTFQENMPVVVIPPQCIGLPKVSPPPQYSLPGQDYPQMYPNYLPKDSYYPVSNMKPGSVQYQSDQLVRQPVQASRNIHVQSCRALPTYPGPQYHQSSPDRPEKVYYPARSIYGQQVVQAANPSFQGAYSGPLYRGYEALGEAAGVVRAAYAKKEVDIGKSLKEYLESWEDDEDIVTNLPDVVLCNNIPAEKQKHVNVSEAKSMSSAEKLSEAESSPQPLYILDSTNISSEALSQYLHIQQIDHLPANIKGYYKIPGVGAALEIPAESLEKPSRPVADQKSQKSTEQELCSALKSAETKANLHTRQSKGPERVPEKAESPTVTPETQAAKSDASQTEIVCAHDYSKTRELNILEATELRIPEIAAELAENAAENASPQDYSVNKRAAAEMSLSADAKMTADSEESHFQNCLPQDFSITRKSDAEPTFHGAEKLIDAPEVTVVSRPVLPQDYSINKQNCPDRLLQTEAGQRSAPENTTEVSVIHPNTPEDYSGSLQEDVALNLSTNRSKFEDSLQEPLSEDALCLEADSSIIEDTTKTSSAFKLQGAMLPGSNEKHVERAGLHDEEKVSSSNTRNLHPEMYANKFSSKLNDDSLDEATAVVEEYMKMQREELQKSDSKLDIAEPPAVTQMHTASVIVQNTFFDDKASSKTPLELLNQPSVPSSTPKIVQTCNQELGNGRSRSESRSPNLHAGKTCINLRSDAQKQPTNRSGTNKDDHNVGEIAQICSEGIAADESSTYSSWQGSEMSSVPSDTPGSVHAVTLQQCSSPVFDSFSVAKPSYESSEHSDVEKQVKQSRKKSLLDDYKQKMDEHSSEQSSSECYDDEDDYTRQRTAGKDARKERSNDGCSGIATSASEDGESFTSDNSDGEDTEFDKERTEESSREEVVTNKYRIIRSSTNEPATEEELGPSAVEDQSNASRGGTLHDPGTVEQNETSQSTTTEEGTDNRAETGTVTDEKVYQDATQEHSTVRHAELGHNMRESTVTLDELSESTTGEEGTTPGDDSQGTTDEDSTITQDEQGQKVTEIGTTEPVLQQSTGEAVPDKESESTIHDLVGFEDANVEDTEQNLKDQHQANSRNNSELLQEIEQEIATNNMVLDDDCKNLACSNNSSAPLQEHTVCQCNEVATSNNRQETPEENRGKCVVLDQVCKTDGTSELTTDNNDNQVAISGVDNREATSGSEPCSEDGAQYEDTASECEDGEDCNDLEQSTNTGEGIACLPRNSAYTSEDENLQTNAEQCEDTASQSQDSELLIDKEETRNITLQYKDTEQDSRGTTQSEDRSLQCEDAELDSVRHSEDEDSLEESRDAVVQSEDRGLQYEGPRLQTEDTRLQVEDAGLEDEETVLQTSTVQAEDTLEDLTKEASKTAEENVPKLKEHRSSISSEDNSCEADKHVRSAISAKSEEFLIEKLLSIHGDTSDCKRPHETVLPTDSFECELENIFENIPADRVVPENVNQVPETYHSVIACLETSTTSKNSVQPETTAQSVDNLKQPEFKIDTLDESELQLETDDPGRTDRVVNIAETPGKASNNECNLEEHHSNVQEMCETVALPQDDLSSRGLDEELSTACDEVPEDLVEPSVHTVREVASPGNVLSAGECLVIYSAADDFVILEEPETEAISETVVQEGDRRDSDTEELICEELGTEQEVVDEQMPMTEQIIGESDEHAQELEVTLIPGTTDEDDVGEKLVVIPQEQEIVTIRPEPDDKQLNPVTVDAEELIETQGIANYQTKLTVQQRNRKLNVKSEEPSQNQVEMPVSDTVKIEDSLHLTPQLQQTYHEMAVQMTPEDVKTERADAELQLVSEIEVDELCLQDIKSEIEEESPMEQELTRQDVGEFEVDVKEEVVSLEICADRQEQLSVNVDLKEDVSTEEVLDDKKHVEDAVGPAVKDEQPEELVKEELLPTDTLLNEKVELKMEDNTSQKNDKKGLVREELEEGELSDDSETEDAQEEVKPDVAVIDDWDEPEELFNSIQLQIPISPEKKLLFARRKKNLEKLKAKLLSAKQTQLASEASLTQIHVPVIKIAEECVQPSIAQSKPSKATLPAVVTPPAGAVHSPEDDMSESNEDKESCRRDSLGPTSVTICQFPKYIRRRSSINSAPSIADDIDQDPSANRSMNSTKFSPRNLTKMSSNFSFDSDEELFQVPSSKTTSTKTKVCSKPITAEATSSVDIVHLSPSSKPSSSSLESRSSKCPSKDLLQCASAKTSSKSDIVKATADDAFQPPTVSKPLGASVEDKELFINPENPRYQPSVARTFDPLASRKRSLSYTDYSSLKIEFTAPKRRYSAMEAFRPVRKPIINLDEISQNISQVLERLDSTEKLRYDGKVTYNERRGSRKTGQSLERARNEVKPVTEKLVVNQDGKVQNKQQRYENDNQFNFAHSNRFYIPMPSHRNKLTSDNHGQKRESNKLDHFKVFEKMTQRKSQKVLPLNLYDDEECVLNEINGQKNAVLDSRSTSEEATASGGVGVSLSQQEPDVSMESDQIFSGTNSPAPFHLEDHKITSTGPQDKATGSARVTMSTEQVDSAHQTSKSQHSNSLTAVEPSTPEVTSSHRSIESAEDVTNVQDDPVESLACVASSHQPGDSATGGYDPLADVPSTLVDPVLVLPNVSYNPGTKRICGVKNGQAKQKLCKNASKMEKSMEGRPGNATSKESSQKKLSENKEVNSNVPHGIEDNETVKSHIETAARQDESQTKMLGAQDQDKLKHKGRNEDSEAKVKRNEGKRKLETSNEDNQNLQASEEDSQKPQATDEECPINCKGRKEDKTKVQGTKADGQMEVQRSREDNQKSNDNQMKSNSPEDEQIKIETSEHKTMVIETEEHIETKTNASSICEGVSRTSQCDAKNSKICKSDDNMVRDTVLMSSTSIGRAMDVDITTAKSSTEIAATISSTPGTSEHIQDDSTHLPARASSIEAILSSIHASSSVVPTGPINIKGGLSNTAVEQSKTHASSSNAKQGGPQSKWTSANAKSGMANMKSGKLNAIIAKLGSASLQAVRTHSSNVIVSSALRSLASVADRSSGTTQRTEDHLVSTVNHRTSSAGQPDPPAGPNAATVGQPVSQGEALASTGHQLTTTADQPIPSGHQVATAGGKIVPVADQHTNSVIQGCSSNVIVSPRITSSSPGTPVQCSTSSLRITASNVPSTGSSKVVAVSGSLLKIPLGISPSASSYNTSSTDTTSCSVIVEPTAPKQKAIDPRSDAKKPERIENKLANTFRLTEYTKSYIKLKMAQEVDSSIANGLKRSDPRLGHKPSADCTPQLKRKLPISEKEASVEAGLDKRVKINLQDYRNRKQHTISSSAAKIGVDHHKNSGDHDGKTSLDDCLGEVVNGIDDFMTVIQTNDVTNEPYSIADDIGNSSSESLCLDLTTRSSHLGMEIYLDDSMELIPGNEEIVHTSKEEEEDVPSEGCLENSGTEELDDDATDESNLSRDRIQTNPIHCSAAGARKMRIRVICKPDSAIDQARFEDVSYPGPSKGVQARAKADDDQAGQDRNEKIPLPKTAMVKLTKETIPTNINRVEPNVTNPLTRRRTKSKGEMKMYRPKRRKKRFRNLYTTDEDEESGVPTKLVSNSPEMLPTVRLKPAPSRMRSREGPGVAASEAIQDSLPSCASPADYSHLVSIEPVPYKCRTSSSAKKHPLRLDESQETSSSCSGGPLDDLPQLTRRPGYRDRPHRRGKFKDDDDSQPSFSDSSDLSSRKLEYKCHINLNALGNKCNMLAADPVQPSTSKVGLKLTLKSVRKEQPAAFGDVLGSRLDSSPPARRSKHHGKRKVPRRELSSAAYSVSTSAANRGWTVNDKVPKVIIKRNGTGYCAVSRDVSTNPIWQPVIRVRRHRYLESLVLQGQADPDRVP